MEPNESALSSYYPHQRHQPQPQPPYQPSPTTTAAVFAASPTNGILSNTERAPQVLYPHSVPSAVETVRRKRGRPRKYGTPEQAAAAKRMSSASAGATIPKKKKQQLGDGGVSSSSKKNQLDALGNAVRGFTPHIISVDAGEDVYQKIMFLMQQSKREICVLSASGSIYNPSLRQPATSGGNITYEGQFDILLLSGSYIRTALGGRTGGLSVCLSSTDGQIIGGGIGGPLKAAGPVQVIVGTFLPDAIKNVIVGATGDASLSKLPSSVGGASVSGVDFRSGVDSSARIPVRGSEDPHSGSQFMIQPRGVQVTTSGATDWIGADARSNSSYELAGRAGHGAHESSENGAYEQLQDYD
ncbi:AT-hook motif nuclear-localized protein [Actinidia chinensis var. chinensis]|uniref:AT-hook motif nuclear-localized protein n=1 Tax=Actinidia chinensis var. chinensis TaxID=1590841 RepID=A0A2R6PKP0_ACTCC|nr:AT-hook motif nuclear-localized protein [Actinidia chinensis var. chinensis]